MIVKKKTQGYGYKYADLSEINATLEELGMSYIQETRTDAQTSEDYIWTAIIDKDGHQGEFHRGAKILQPMATPKNNPMQLLGQAITYARRYSLMMTLGIACDDDDGKSLEGQGIQKPHKDFGKLEENKMTKEQGQRIAIIIGELKKGELEVIEDLKNQYNANSPKELTEAQADDYIHYLEAQRESK